MYKLFVTLLLFTATLCTISAYADLGCKEPRQGPPGPRGHRGPAGSPGDPGTPFSPSFASAFRTTPQNDGIAPGGAVIFDQLAIPVQGSEISYNNSTGTVTFNATGFFEVTYGTSMSEDNRAGGIVLQMNPAGVYSANPGFSPGTGLVPGSENDNAFGDELISLTVVVQVTSIGQTMQLVNGSSFNIQLDTLSSDTSLTPIVAYLVVKKLQ